MLRACPIKGWEQVSEANPTEAQTVMSRAIVFLTRFLTRAFVVYCWVLAIHYAVHAL